MLNDKTIDGKKNIVILLNKYKIFDIVYEKLIELKTQILKEMILDNNLDINLYTIFKFLPINKFNINDVLLYDT